MQKILDYAVYVLLRCFDGFMIGTLIAILGLGLG